MTIQSIKVYCQKAQVRFFRWLNDLLSDYANAQALTLWIAAFATGLVAVFYAQLFRYGEEQFLHLMQSKPWLAFVITPLAFWISRWTVRKFGPNAQGSGIPQVLAAIEVNYDGPGRILVDRLLSKRTVIIKILSSLICVLGGGAIGREGPTLQISAGVFHLFGRQLRRFYHHADQKIWLIAGASSGLASAFNTPLGGIVYAIEEVGREHFHRAKTAVLTSIIISGLVAQWILGSYLYLGFPKLSPITFSFLPTAVLVGFLAGSMGALFSRALIRAAQIKMRQTFWFPILCGLFVAALIYIQPLNAGGGTDLINAILFQGQVADSELVVGRIFSTMFTYLSGCAGGIFSPALAIGATIGSFLNTLLNSGYPNLLPLLGMIGFLTGLTQTPFTSFILVLEMTDRHSAVFPMMLTALIAHASARSISKDSFYEVIKAQFLPQSPPPETR